MRLDSPNHRKSEFDRLRIAPIPDAARTFIGAAILLAAVSSAAVILNGFCRNTNMSAPGPKQTCSAMIAMTAADP